MCFHKIHWVRPVEQVFKMNDKVNENMMLIHNDEEFKWLDDLDMFDNVFKIHGLLLENVHPDYETVTLDEDHPDQDMLQIIDRHFGVGADYIQVVFKNNNVNQDIQASCPFFRVFINSINNKTPINYKLENFLKRCKSPWNQVRCEKALVFGLFSATDMSRFASVPFEFQNYFESQSETRQSDDSIKSSTICLSGNKKYLPVDIQRLIMRFIIHPCAQLIKQYWKLFDVVWDLHFMDIKQEWKN